MTSPTCKFVGLFSLAAASFFCDVSVSNSIAQSRAQTRSAPWHIVPTPETRRKVADLIGEIREAEITMLISPNKSKLIRTKHPVLRFSATDPSVMEIIQHSPTEFEIIGHRSGQTTFTIWFSPAKLEKPAKGLKLQRGAQLPENKRAEQTRMAPLQSN